VDRRIRRFAQVRHDALIAKFRRRVRLTAQDAILNRKPIASPMETAMKKLAIALGLGLVLAAVVVGGVSGMIGAEIAVAAYIAIVAPTATMLVLTSRPAPTLAVDVAPQREQPRRSDIGVSATADTAFARA
jgi:hypothetical protein